MNVVRMNMSHADHESAQKIIGWIRTLNRKLAYPVAILLDTQGPEIRTGETDEPMDLKTGDVVTVTVRPGDVETTSIHVNYQELIDVLDVGNRMTVDNGLINFEVLEKDGEHLVCKVIDGGTLGSRRHVNLPGVRVNLPAITSKDRKDIAFGLENDVDFIALSFVRTADDIVELRELMGAKSKNVKVIAKIEDQEGVNNIHAIVDQADGVMVARGDLGIETNIADLPNVQRRIVHAASQRGKRSIVATHLLESMIENPIPTRAEVTDVANAIYEGVDAVMLSGETSIGKYPVRCVEQLDEIGFVEGLGEITFEPRGVQGIGGIAGDFSLSSETPEKDLLCDDNETQAGGSESAALLLGEVGAEVLDGDRAGKVNTMGFLQPTGEALERTAGGQLVVVRQPALGGEEEDEIVDGVEHGGSCRRFFPFVSQDNGTERNPVLLRLSKIHLQALFPNDFPPTVPVPRKAVAQSLCPKFFSRPMVVR